MRLNLAIGLPLAVCGTALLAYFALRPKPREWPDFEGAVQTEARLREACADAADDNRLLLIEFSAPWCDVCRELKQRVREAEVERELSRFELVVVNIGEGRELDELRKQMGARAIPYWTVVRPESCGAALATWPRLASQHPTADSPALRAWLGAVH